MSTKNDILMRPSELSRVAVCPYSKLHYHPTFNESTDYAQKGTEMHKVLEYALNEEELDEELTITPSSIKDACNHAECIKEHIASRFGTHNYELLTEIGGSIPREEVNGVLCKGTMDIVAYCQNKNLVLIIDYKTGRKDVKISGAWQLSLYKEIFKFTEFYKSINGIKPTIETYVYQPYLYPKVNDGFLKTISLDDHTEGTSFMDMLRAISKNLATYSMTKKQNEGCFFCPVLTCEFSKAKERREAFVKKHCEKFYNKTVMTYEELVNELKKDMIESSELQIKYRNMLQKKKDLMKRLDKIIDENNKVIPDSLRKCMQKIHMDEGYRNINVGWESHATLEDKQKFHKISSFSGLPQGEGLTAALKEGYIKQRSTRIFKIKKGG